MRDDGVVMEQVSGYLSRPVGPAWFDDIQNVVDREHGGCPCKIVGSFLAHLSMPISSRMHLDLDAKYTRDEWLQHFQEEDDVIVPLMSRHGMVQEAERILSDHKRFRRQIRWLAEELSAHAGREDQDMVRLLNLMKLDVARRAA